MSHSEIVALLPYMIVIVAAMTAMLAIAFYRNHLLTASICIGGLVLALISLPILASSLPQQVTALLILDQYAFMYLGMIFGATIAIACLAYGYLKKSKAPCEEFYLLLLTAALGAGVLVAASHFAALVLGLETLSVSLYALIAYLRTQDRGIEAALKYLILAAVSSAFLIFGMALLYAEYGTMDFSHLAGIAAGPHKNTLFLSAGIVLIITGLGFKLALVPFHMWTPDVYEGAPAPVAAFIATVSKGAVFALLLRFVSRNYLAIDGPLFTVFSILAVVTMVVGNLLALLQENVKRLLAYSSIAHLGYLLVAFLASGVFVTAAVTFYLLAYFITVLGAFGIIIVLSDGRGDAEDWDCYRSLAWRRPWVAGIFTLMLLSLAGIPLTAGFVGKFYVLAAGIQSSLWKLVLVLAISSAIGVFYYLRLIVAMFARPEEVESGEGRVLPSSSALDRIVLGFLLAILLYLGLYPGPLIEVLQKLLIH